MPEENKQESQETQEGSVVKSKPHTMLTDTTKKEPVDNRPVPIESKDATAEDLAEETPTVERKRTAIEEMHDARALDRQHRDKKKELRKKEKLIDAMNAEANTIKLIASGLIFAMKERVVIRGVINAIDVISLQGTAKENDETAYMVYVEIPSSVGGRTIEVQVPFNELFASDPLDEETIDGSTISGRKNRRKRMHDFCRGLIGGITPIIITNVEMDEHEGIYDLKAAGSRRRALEIEQVRNLEGTNPSVQNGDRVEAYITRVKPHSLYVLVAGVDIKMPRSTITYKYVPNFIDEYKAGQKIEVIVDNIEKGTVKGPGRKNNAVTYKLTASHRDVELQDALVKQKYTEYVGRTCHAVVTSVLSLKSDDPRYDPAHPSTQIGVWLAAGMAGRVVNWPYEALRHDIHPGDKIVVAIIGKTERGMLKCAYEGYVAPGQFLNR